MLLGSVRYPRFAPTGEKRRSVCWRFERRSRLLHGHAVRTDGHLSDALGLSGSLSAFTRSTVCDRGRCPAIAASAVTRYCGTGSAARSLKTMNRSVVGVLAFAAMISASTLARADCTKDTDCKGDRVCTAGACVDPASPKVQTPDDTAQPVPPVVASLPPPAPPPAPVVASPAAPAQRTQSRPQRETGTRDTGVGLFVGGLVLDAIGAGMYYGGSRAKCDLGKSDCNTVAQAGIGVLIVGGLLTVVGISVWVVGSSQGPVAAARNRRVVPYVNVGLSGGEASFQF